jgi:hypothetical protein
MIPLFRAEWSVIGFGERKAFLGKQSFPSSNYYREILHSKVRKPTKIITVIYLSADVRLWYYPDTSRSVVLLGNILLYFSSKMSPTLRAMFAFS